MYMRIQSEWVFKAMHVFLHMNKHRLTRKATTRKSRYLQSEYLFQDSMVKATVYDFGLSEKEREIFTAEWIPTYLRKQYAN
ncbi:MAG: hypothetical protein A2Y12_10375 [Planctomycetes bacterium GWF2_42_9]|nr:MAG: hypothetical protein A2Y12_10375 [Planctomycetes bacterium GWF2_42_9]